MHTKYRNIQEVGLKTHLDETAERHGGNDYAKFVELYDQRHVNQLNLARIFLVTRHTMKKYILIHEQERSNEQAG